MFRNKIDGLVFTTLRDNSADDKLITYFLFFPENRIWHFIQINVKLFLY